MVEKEVTLSQGVVRYREDGEGPALVFVHGILVSGALWRKVVPPLARSHRCIVPDWPLGSHAVALNEDADVTPDGVAALIGEFLDALDLHDVTLVGNDSGGALCQLVAARRHPRVGRLVLTTCDAFEAFPPKAFAYLRWVGRVPGLLATLGALMWAVPPLRRLSIAYGALTQEPLPDSLLEEYLRPGLRDRGVRRDLRKFLAGVSPQVTIDAAAKLRDFAGPTLIVWSADDRFFPVALGERLHAAIPGSRFQVVPDARVFLPEDQPAELAARIDRFMNETRPAAA